MECFEYKTMMTDVKGVFGGKIDDFELECQLNNMGTQGWELINVVPSAQSNGNTRWLISVFKRKIV